MKPKCMQRAGISLKADCTNEATHRVPNYFFRKQADSNGRRTFDMLYCDSCAEVVQQDALHAQGGAAVTLRDKLLLAVVIFFAGLAIGMATG